MLHYPSVKCVRDNAVYFVDGTRLPYDDKLAKSFDQRLEHADIKDHFAQAYPALAPIVPPKPHSDPGRFRNDALLKKLYGATKQEIEKNLVPVVWLPTHSGEKLLFNRNENASAQLQKVSDELEKLPRQLLKYLMAVAGTYQYRPIKGTNRLSTHSYGISIDTKFSCYWLWDNTHYYRNEIPQEIVDIFEKYEVVWGGRWYHYDTMHFEYRPEMFDSIF